MLASRLDTDKVSCTFIPHPTLQYQQVWCIKTFFMCEEISFWVNTSPAKNVSLSKRLVPGEATHIVPEDFW